jgi:hypothetical protein
MQLCIPLGRSSVNNVHDGRRFTSLSALDRYKILKDNFDILLNLEFRILYYLLSVWPLVKLFKGQIGNDLLALFLPINENKLLFHISERLANLTFIDYIRMHYDFIFSCLC